MTSAVNRLQKEFHRILSSQREILDSETLFSGSRSFISPSHSYSSLSDLDSEDSVRSSMSTDISDLRCIADCMIHCGHGKECIDIYRLVRRSVIEEGVYKLGFDRLSPAQIQKLSWAILESKIQTWVTAAKSAVRVLYSGERVLCSQIFPSTSIIESLFSEITSDVATALFSFPEKLESKVKLSPEKMFRFLDMHETLLELLPEIESIFSYQSTSGVRTQVEKSLGKTGVAIRSMIEDLELSIQNESSKITVPGGGLHPLARWVANYLTVLADYKNSLEDIFWEQPLNTSPSPIPEESSLSTTSSLMERLSFLLLCKLDSKAELYRDPALGYLFLANNLKYVVNKVMKSGLLELLGEEWAATHAARAKEYMAKYERLAWNEVMEAIPGDLSFIEEMERETAALQLRRFNLAFETACKRQAGWVVADRRMEEDTKLSIAQKIISAYRPLYMKCRGDGVPGSAIRFAPEDLAHWISDLFCENPGTSVASSGVGSSRDVSSRRGH